jgi:hypothetical protein
VALKLKDLKQSVSAGEVCIHEAILDKKVGLKVGQTVGIGFDFNKWSQLFLVQPLRCTTSRIVCIYQSASMPFQPLVRGFLIPAPARAATCTSQWIGITQNSLEHALTCVSWVGILSSASVGALRRIYVELHK